MQSKSTFSWDENGSVTFSGLNSSTSYYARVRVLGKSYNGVNYSNSDYGYGNATTKSSITQLQTPTLALEQIDAVGRVTLMVNNMNLDPWSGKANFQLQHSASSSFSSPTTLTKTWNGLEDEGGEWQDVVTLNSGETRYFRVKAVSTNTSLYRI